MKSFFSIILLLSTFHLHAVSINSQGLGNVHIIPYYTVNNHLNTLVTVSNTTQHAKAIKINIREGLHGYAALSYNVYLDAYDTWSFGLLAATSPFEGYQGQDSAKLVSSDHSCAPFLNKSGAHFLPDNLVDGPPDLVRTREGFIEIIEMADIIEGGVDSLFALVDQNSNSYPLCTDDSPFFVENSGIESQLSPGTGGLMAEAQLVNVLEGINFSIPVIAMDDFLPDETIVHVQPQDSSLSLDAAAPYASLTVGNRLYQLSFDHGIDAVSAILMSKILISDYDLSTTVAGVTEMITTQPTRRFYTSYHSNIATSPLYENPQVHNCPLLSYGGFEYSSYLSDRHSQSDISPFFECSNVQGCFPPPPPAICGSVFILQVGLPGIGASSNITASNNSYQITAPGSSRVLNGQFRIGVDTRNSLMATDNITQNVIELIGKPIIGLTLQRFTNARASEGLLAQYGGGRLAKSEVGIKADGVWITRP